MKLLVVFCVFVALSFAEDNVSLVEEEEEYAPYQTAIEYLEETYGIMDECKTMHQACMGAATTMRERVKCFIQLGLCVGAKAVGCSKTCVMPLIQCKIAAGHDWPAVFQCCKDFISCAIGGCKGGEQESPRIEDAVLEDEDYTPYETAIGYLQQNYGIADECKTMHQACMGAATTMHERVRCFVQLGLCVGAKVVGCSKQCVMPLIQCKIAAGHDWPAVFQCCKDFIQCAIGGCKGQPPSIEDGVPFEEDEYSPYETAITLLEQNYGIVDECKTMHQACMGAATTGRERVRCFIQLGLCVGAKVVGCSKTCVMPLIQCKIAAGHNWPAVFQCCKDFIQCAIGGCKGGDESSNLMDMELTQEREVAFDGGIQAKCQEMFGECMGAAASIVQRGQCVVQLGLCLGAKLVDCSKDCIAPMLQCKSEAIGDFHKLLQCNIQFVKCAIGGCKNLTASLATNDEGITAQCQELYQECSAAASGILQRGQCLVQLGLCLAARLVACSKDCIAPMLMCKAKAVGSFHKLLQCNIDFVKCAIGGCTNGTALLSAEEFVMPNVPEALAECVKERAHCWKKHGRRGQCTLKYIFCVLAKVSPCIRECMPGFAECSIAAAGDKEKLKECPQKFTKCVAVKCHLKEAAPLATNDDGIAAQCQELYKDCSAAAIGIWERGQCTVQYGLCMAASLVACAKDCIAPMLMCKAKALGSFRKLLHCNVVFVQCAIGGCSNGTALLSAEELKVPAVLEECVNDRIQCRKDHRSPWECTERYIFCVLSKVGPCLKSCMPGFASCLKEAKGDKEKLKECPTKFTNCIIEKCKLKPRIQ